MWAIRFHDGLHERTMLFDLWTAQGRNAGTMSEPMTVFDRRAVRLHRDRAARTLGEHDFLFRESAARLVDRLDDIVRQFPQVLDLGCHSGEMSHILDARSGIETLVQCDLSARMAASAGGLSVAADEELLPFADGAFDLIISNLSLHWVNDLPGALIQARRALKPDGLFLAAMLGGHTLTELRQSLMEAETKVEGGFSPRVSPFVDVRDGGDLLQRAGFALPVADADVISVSYTDPFRLLADLRGMGETNAVFERRKGATRRATLMAAAEAYRNNFGGPDGRLPATFEVIYLTAWAPHPSQQKPLRPGSARSRLSDALDTTEIPAGDHADPDPEGRK
jgi:NADH dehydrogenase [ubiquinone] 1 alpha subcomplex assembly factor 5